MVFYLSVKSMTIKPFKRHSYISIPVILSVSFLISICFTSMHNYIYHWLGGVYFPMSMLCFLAYAKDKWAAKKNSWRIKESRLQLMALLGGWPGAVLAQTWLRHKCSKTSFLMVFWLASLANICMLSLIIYHQYQQQI